MTKMKKDLDINVIFIVKCVQNKNKIIKKETEIIKFN